MDRLKSKRWGIYAQWLCGAMLLVLLAGCQKGVTSLPGEGRSPGALVQSVSLEEIYWATPAIAPRLISPRPIYSATTDSATTDGATTTEVQATSVATATLLQEGAALYTVNCAPCHQANGEGQLGRFPALNQNAFVTNRSPIPLIRTVLYGRGLMPAFHLTLREREVAAVLSYIRNSWNNEATMLEPATVQGIAPMPLATSTPRPE